MNSGTASQAAPHERRLRGFFVHPVAPYVLSTGTIARVGRGLDPEARAASESPGFEPGRAVTFAGMLPTAPLRPRTTHYEVGSVSLSSCPLWPT